MAIKSTAHPRQKNLQPISDILYDKTRGFDVRAIAGRPVDGEWLVCSGVSGGVASRTFATGTDVKSANVQKQLLLRPQWSESMRSDTSAARMTKVPVLYKGDYVAHFHLWTLDDDDTFEAGDMLRVVASSNHLGDGVTRNVLTKYETVGANHHAAVVGHVVSPPGESGSEVTKPLTAFIYSSPVMYKNVNS